ncbi:MAG: hypothetical protein JWO80_201, partial [Bryobacterales bacterium]|nr:hypothetical protein [Bryobacterales bacterium]
SDVLHPQHAELTISVKEPVSHVHRTFEIPDVHLIDYAIPCRDGKYQKQSSY